MPSNGFTETVKESETEKSVPKPTYNYKPLTKEEREALNREAAAKERTDAVSDTSKYSAVVFSVPPELQEKPAATPSEDDYEDDFEDAFEKSNGDGSTEGDKLTVEKDSGPKEIQLI
mmetsp:Transcript_26533/g.40518  ORF Transcript_26533/g.40518 Transcript_26533/m.40518 type:complete len:117 (+) Transcript_26533:737-1087(+)|eukprot:CAMPEP_0170488070 /NCGR_PEP_ID=MMETSP0208-20121228/6695_1 /TAXON_ID=197538 /ORGANISM="Strombidium inclinatum, Strain S3" /LENGTH=116 /DNA_ID=CAMNT_0010762507 /DNA_START=1282 /DNA_END=1632 /DNA_ORIENTATION=+